MKCEEHGCTISTEAGGALYRVSPTGGPFVGRCWKHLTPVQQAEHSGDRELIADIRKLA